MIATAGFGYAGSWIASSPGRPAPSQKQSWDGRNYDALSISGFTRQTRLKDLERQLGPGVVTQSHDEITVSWPGLRYTRDLHCNGASLTGNTLESGGKVIARRGELIGEQDWLHHFDELRSLAQNPDQAPGDLAACAPGNGQGRSVGAAYIHLETVSTACGGRLQQVKECSLEAKV